MSLLKHMRLHLVDVEMGLVEAWRSSFAGCAGVDIAQGDILTAASGAVVSPANSLPADYARWIANGMSLRAMQQRQASRSGTFSVAMLPEGDYLLTAFEPEEPAGWPDRRVVEAAA